MQPGQCPNPDSLILVFAERTNPKILIDRTVKVACDGEGRGIQFEKLFVGPDPKFLPGGVQKEGLYTHVFKFPVNPVMPEINPIDFRDRGFL